MACSGRADSRIGTASPGRGIVNSVPLKEILLPSSAWRMICTVSRILASGRANGTPCRPSMTCGPDAPRPSRNRPPDRFDRVIAVCATAAGVRMPSCMMPDPSSMRWVRAA